MGETGGIVKKTPNPSTERSAFILAFLPENALSKAMRVSIGLHSTANHGDHGMILFSGLSGTASQSHPPSHLDD